VAVLAVILVEIPLGLPATAFHNCIDCALEEIVCPAHFPSPDFRQ
jgi:hypothetical protein